MVTQGTEFKIRRDRESCTTAQQVTKVCRIPIHAELSSSMQSASAGVGPVKDKNEVGSPLNSRTEDYLESSMGFTEKPKDAKRWMFTRNIANTPSLSVFNGTQRMQPKSIEDWFGQRKRVTSERLDSWAIRG
ncbi:uncharacterized protein FOMMEDRAFT_163128 [Fomitiporia mediterranea MF3/22]|uniref:Uncharacterized protein n=1 Tax=Fomitiporia mediterranea (strain MF3/22) TaxID=694068 RepID=R7SFJ9_FOMME|nr:uncharacterized protein FOMMEDRAFT_163128 [Fomitiporia mediterranea MF3/22]EJC97483.1 hypothetical protein FOMMEDRAFT_163128 [Fomitiporia mediterranea MF3/22]